MTDLYTIDKDKRYSFLGTVKEFITDQIQPKLSGYKTPDHWNRERIILQDVKILEDNEYKDFEPKIKMDLGKQFKVAKVGDIITFDAKVGFVEPFYDSYDIDDRGEHTLTLGYQEDYGYRWYNEHINYSSLQELEKDLPKIEKKYNNFHKAKKESPHHIKDWYGYVNFNYDYDCTLVRRLKNPSKIKVKPM